MGWLATRALTVAVAVAGVAACAGQAVSAADAEFDFAGYAAADLRIFPYDPADRRQNANLLSPSVVLQPEFRVAFEDGNDRLTAVPFFRYDADDTERTHFDLRELHWLHDGGEWDLLVGIGKVFWGVAESRHLVDIVNQTDAVEIPDEEEKLGQPMVNLNLISDWGTVGLFVLPGFRERTFPAGDARLRGLAPVAVDDPVFDAQAGRYHIDFAARWSHAVGDWDLGLSVFRGTGREPRLVPEFRAGGAPVLVPHYDIIDQESLDLQYTAGSWLWKLEAMSRGGQGKRFAAVVAGFEYTFFGVLGSNVDIGVLAEYLYDGRDSRAPATPHDDDIFVAVRLALNDVGGTALLAGAIIDRNSGAASIGLEGKTRLSDRWTVELEAEAFSGVPASDALFGIRRDDFIQLRLVRYF